MFHVKHRTQKYEKLVDFLLERNVSINLTAIRSREEALTKHIEDSLVVSDHILNHHPATKTLLDLGTGAGFPGLVIASEHPEINVTLLDSTQKKIRFVDEAVVLLNLKNTNTVADRVETFSLINSSIFDCLVVRSVARLDALLEYAAPLLKLGGVLLAMKSVNTLEELSIGQAVAGLFGFNEAVSFPYTLMDQERTLFSYMKTSNSSISLPRKIGDAVNNPIQRRS